LEKRMSIRVNIMGNPGRRRAGCAWGARLGLVLAVLAGLCAGELTAGGWWNAKWPNRVRVKLDTRAAARVRRAKLPGDDIAVVQFRTAGLADKSGRDIRVVSASGKVLPSRILQTGPGDLLRLAFAASGGSKYYIYFNNANAPASQAKPLEIRRGVLLEVWPYAGGQARNITQARKTLARASQAKPIGRGFRDRIFLGHNPFGPQSKIVQRYTAYFLAPKAGEYRFVISSNNASFLLINDRLIISDGGWHGPRRYPNHTGTISLNKGPAKLTLIHINPWGWAMAMVAWQRGDRPLIAPIPPGAYTEIIPAQAGPIERYSSAGGVDFTVGPGGEAFVENRYFQRRVFRVQTTGRRLGKKTRWAWDFGDGQQVVSPGESVEHIYLRPGTYGVTVKLQKSRKTKAKPSLARTHRVHVDRDWNKITRNKLDSLKDYAKIVAGYNFAALDAQANLNAALLLRRAGDFDALSNACKAFVTRAKASDKQIQRLLAIYVQALLADGRASQAVAALKKAATMSTDPDTQATMLLRAGRLQLDQLDKPDAAMKTFDAILAKLTGHAKASLLRQGRIGIGDAWLARSQADKARLAYAQAGPGDGRAKKYPGIVRGDFARQAEDYLRRRNYPAAAEAVEKWERTLPADKLTGYSTLLRCEVLLARKKYADAARQAERLVNANPQSNYAASLLKLAIRAYTKINKPRQANRCQERIIKNYPENREIGK